MTHFDTAELVESHLSVTANAMQLISTSYQRHVQTQFLTPFVFVKLLNTTKQNKENSDECYSLCTPFVAVQIKLKESL